MAPTPARLPLFFFQAEDGIRDFCLSRGLGDVYKRQCQSRLKFLGIVWHRKVVLAVSSRAMPWADFQSVRVLVLLRAPPEVSSGGDIAFSSSPSNRSRRNGL